jgi:hypothetical protein
MTTPSRQIRELLRIYDCRFDLGCDPEALGDLLGDSPANSETGLVWIRGGLSVPELTRDGREVARALCEVFEAVK